MRTVGAKAVLAWKKKMIGAAVRARGKALSLLLRSRTKAREPQRALAT
jgi:hypothetical protein